MNNDKLIQELVNRKPSRWGNVTIKEFERDITLLQNTVLILQHELSEQKSKTQVYINNWISTMIDNFELMDDYIPEWRLQCKDQIKQLDELLKLKSL